MSSFMAIDPSTGHEFAELLTNLLTSEHVVSLPVETVRAAQWFRHGLLAEMRPSG